MRLDAIVVEVAPLHVAYVANCTDMRVQPALRRGAGAMGVYSPASVVADCMDRLGDHL